MLRITWGSLILSVKNYMRLGITCGTWRACKHQVTWNKPGVWEWQERPFLGFEYGAKVLCPEYLINTNSLNSHSPMRSLPRLNWSYQHLPVVSPLGGKWLSCWAVSGSRGVCGITAACCSFWSRGMRFWPSIYDIRYGWPVLKGSAVLWLWDLKLYNVPFKVCLQSLDPGML